MLTEKQREYVRECRGHRWSFATGAVRSGKSWLACAYVIPSRVVGLAGRRGLNVILGSTRDNIERNVLTPMRDLIGVGAVTEINSRNECRIAGERVLCIGAEKANQVARLRGSEIKFCYCDEIADIHPDVFEMLKSRLSLPWSECHAACNPAGPQHYVKRFIDSAEEAGIDLYCQTYTLYDNPFLPPEYVRSLEAEYRGTVYEKRYIWGEWAQAEGLVYPMWEEALEEPYGGPVRDWALSVDYGTQNATAALLWASDGSVWHAVREYYHSGRAEGHQKTGDDYALDLVEMVRDVDARQIRVIVDPSAASFKANLRRVPGGRFAVTDARNDVLDGLRETAVCMQRGAVRVSRGLRNWQKEAAGYVWDDKASGDAPLKADDHLMDATRYLVATMHLMRRSEGMRARAAR